MITQLSDSSNVLILGGVAVGLSSLSLLILAGKYLLKKFAPGPDGKRPSISNVASELITTAKEKASTVLKEVSGDIEQAVKQEVSAVMKDPKSLITKAKNPGELLKSVIKSTTLKNIPKQVAAPVEEAASSSIQIEIPNVPVESTTATTIQIDHEQLETLQKMLELMNKPRLNVQTISPPNEPSVNPPNTA
jgi:hypothetical protein